MKPCVVQGVVLSPQHTVCGKYEKPEKGSKGRKARKGVVGESAEMPKDASEAGGAIAALCPRKGTEAVHLATDGPYFPQSTFKSPLKAPAPPAWWMHEMWDVLDAFGHSSKLGENRKINSKNDKKGTLKSSRKSAVQTPQEREYLCKKPLRMHSLKVIPSDSVRLPFLWKILKQLLLEHRELLS